MAFGDRSPLNRMKEHNDNKETLAGGQVDIPYTPVLVESKNELIVLDNKDFDYNGLDEDTTSFLKLKELEIHTIMQGAYTDIGRVLKEAQDRLAHSYQGTFTVWVASVGFKKDTAYRLIKRYEFIKEQDEMVQKRLEALSISLIYEVTKDSTPIEIKEKVINGEINNRKDFMKIIKEAGVTQELKLNPEKNTKDIEDKKFFRCYFSQEELEQKKRMLLDYIGNNRPQNYEDDVKVVEAMIKLIFAKVY